MSDIRFWHPAHDAYHSAFRMLQILLAHNKVISVEKLYLLDFFVAYPFLLHTVHVPKDMKATMRALHLPKPESYFINLPNNPILYRDMHAIQLEAVNRLVGRGLLAKDRMLKRDASLIRTKVPQELLARVRQRNAQEREFLEFLVKIYGGRPMDELKKSTGLTRRAI